MNSALLSATETLLENYQITDIILIVFLVALAIKEIINVIDFFKNKAKDKLKKEDSSEDQKDQIKQILDQQKARDVEIKELKESLQTLITSDKNDIKAWITEQYRILMKQGWVDDYELDCIERRFNDYIKEGGNSYIEDLVVDIRKLPKVQPIEKRIETKGD